MVVAFTAAWLALGLSVALNAPPRRLFRRRGPTGRPMAHKTTRQAALRWTRDWGPGRPGSRPVVAARQRGAKRARRARHQVGVIRRLPRPLNACRDGLRRHGDGHRRAERVADAGEIGCLGPDLLEVARTALLASLAVERPGLPSRLDQRSQHAKLAGRVIATQGNGAVIQHALPVANLPARGVGAL